MKSTIIVSCVLAAAAGLLVAGEVTLSLKQTQGLRFSCSLTNRYEVTAYAAQPRSTALGRTAGVGNMNLNVYLGRTTSPRIWPDDPSGHNYGDHFWHSAQFRGDNPQQQGYWSELLGADAFGLK
jgi:hypothetical protein